MATLRIGIIGMGGIGMHHAAYLARGVVENVALAAFSSRDPQRLVRAQAAFPAAQAFRDHAELLRSGACDAVLIATPHRQHPGMVAEALAANRGANTGQGMHVLVEKPLAATLSESLRMVEISRQHPAQVFGVMLNQRTSPLHQKVRAMVLGGELGAIQRITWVATHWYRPDAYYRSSPWRATWKGEGGGVLINQAHHNLDLLGWMTAMMPVRVTAIGGVGGGLGKHHAIETEDEVSAILEYANGAVGHFITSTGEAGGVNRLEIAGTRGRLVMEEDGLRVHRLAVDAREFSRTATEPFSAPDVRVEEIAVNAPAEGVPDHALIVQDFARVIAEGKPSESLLAPGADGVLAVALGNALLMSLVKAKPVELPLNAAEYDAFLANLVAPG